MPGAMAAVVALPHFRDTSVPTHQSGPMNDKCEACGAYNFSEERVGTDHHFTLCCQNKKISPKQLRHVPPPPPEILEILRGASPPLRRAREQLNQYNNAFAFVSYGTACFKDMATTRGPPVTICHGAVYHSSGFLFPDETSLAKYAQVYLYDPNEALEARRGNAFNQGLTTDQLQSLQDMMDRVSPLREALPPHARRG